MSGRYDADGGSVDPDQCWLPVQRLGDGRGARRHAVPASPLAVSDQSRDAVRRQNATYDDNYIEPSPTNDPTDEDSTAVFTLCLWCVRSSN